MSIQPLNSHEEKLVIDEVDRYIGLIDKEFAVNLPRIPVRFDLIGSTIGMYCKKRGERSIRFNSHVFSKYWQENFTDTIPHEVAHYVSDMLFDYRYIKPHGPQWQSIMHFFGANPKARCYFDLSGISKRQIKRFDYACRCGTQQLTAIRHNRIQSGKRRYYCRACSAELVALY